MPSTTPLNDEAAAIIADADTIRTAVEDYSRLVGLTPRRFARELQVVSDQFQQMVARHPGLGEMLDGDGDDTEATHRRTTRYLEGLVEGAGANVATQSLEARRVVAAVGIIQIARVTVLTRLALQAA